MKTYQGEIYGFLRNEAEQVLVGNHGTLKKPHGSENRSNRPTRDNGLKALPMSWPAPSCSALFRRVLLYDKRCGPNPWHKLWIMNSFTLNPAKTLHIIINVASRHKILHHPTWFLLYVIRVVGSFCSEGIRLACEGFKATEVLSWKRTGSLYIVQWTKTISWKLKRQDELDAFESLISLFSFDVEMIYVHTYW